MRTLASLKKQTMKHQFLIIILFIGCISCHDDDDACTDISLNTTSLESAYNCNETKYQMDIDLTDNYVIIRNSSDFDELVTGNCVPEIDFSMYDLVIGKKGLAHGNTSIDYELIEDCTHGNQTLRVTFNQNETTEAPNLTYHSLIPKLGEEQGVTVEIIIN